MKLRIIGTGSKGNAYILGNENEALLIEAGVNIKEIKQALDFDYSKVVGCVVTHEHLDHCKSANDLMRLGIDVYTGAKTHQKINGDVIHRAMPIASRETIKLGNFKIMAFDVKHDAVEPLGFLIEHKDCGKVLFLTDTYYCKYTFPGLNNIIIEANYSKEIIDKKYGPDSDKEFLRDRILQSHFSLANCKDMLKANDLRQVNNIVLIHLSDSNSDEKQFHKEVSELTNKNVHVASNGMVIDFKKTPF
ncbi:MAG: MBL fold metallo-hydrolase [Flavobacterium sp.]|uniref:MBL fold metallo-hydrolase n=1 Tax=Flavobacterium sp. TaxID=239 RepID=UPI002B4640B3|nr:MBL fold metallo-hydrolase [Flavobacterium sp.]WRH74187.1 MAG: MBL fold metallo-hydrolase [Flavobacterium sp.]